MYLLFFMSNFFASLVGSSENKIFNSSINCSKVENTEVLLCSYIPLLIYVSAISAIEAENPHGYKVFSVAIAVTIAEQSAIK